MYFSIEGVDGMKNVKDDERLRKANLEVCKTEQRRFVDTLTFCMSANAPRWSAFSMGVRLRAWHGQKLTSPR